MHPAGFNQLYCLIPLPQRFGQLGVQLKVSAAAGRVRIAAPAQFLNGGMDTNTTSAKLNGVRLRPPGSLQPRAPSAEGSPLRCVPATSSSAVSSGRRRIRRAEHAHLASPVSTVGSSPRTSRRPARLDPLRLAPCPSVRTREPVRPGSAAGTSSTASRARTGHHHYHALESAKHRRRRSTHPERSRSSTVLGRQRTRETPWADS
jgi:hypothetical protein